VARHILEEVLELVINSVNCLLLNGFSVIGFLSVHKVNVVVLEPLVLELPLLAGLLLEFSLVFVHVLLEFSLPSWLEVDLLHNLIWDVGDVEEDHDHVRLFSSQHLALFSHVAMLFVAVNELFWVAIFDQLFSLLSEGADVGESICIEIVGQNLVPRSALDGFLGNDRCIQNANGVWVSSLEAVVVHQVLVLHDDLISLRKLNAFVKVRKILVHTNTLVAHLETPFCKRLFEDLLENVNANRVNSKDGRWSGPGNMSLEEMLRLHWLRGVTDVGPDVPEHLHVADHPASVNEEEQWGKSQTLDTVLRQLVIHGCWSLHVPGNNHSLSYILVEVVDSGNWEEGWHSHTVHHRDIGDIEHTGVLEVDNVVSSTPDRLEFGHGSGFGLIW